MGQILLVRHGQASWGSDNYDVLSPVGERQAGVVGAALARQGVRPDLVVHGTMKRQRDTARLAAEAAGWDGALEEDAGWDEMDHLSVLAAANPAHGEREPTRAEFQAWFESATDRWIDAANDPDYVEPFSVFSARVMAALERVEGRVGRGSAVVFTSGGPISMVTSSLTDGGAAAYRRTAPVVINGSITRVVVGRRGTSLVGFNDHAHFLDGGDSDAPELLTYR